MSIEALKGAFPWFFEPPPRCTYQYAYGRVCDGLQSEHKWRPKNAPRNEPIEPSIFDHTFAPSTTPRNR